MEIGVSTQRLELPAVVATYQAAHDGHEVDAALSTFTQDAVVHDEDQDWVGAEQIRQWLVATSTEYTPLRGRCSAWSPAVLTRGSCGIV